MAAEPAQSGGRRQSKLAEAKEWLADFLKDGPKGHQAVLAAGSEMQHSYATLRRAADALKVIRRPARSEDGRKIEGWVWELPSRAS